MFLNRVSHAAIDCPVCATRASGILDVLHSSASEAAHQIYCDISIGVIYIYLLKQSGVCRDCMSSSDK